MLSGWFEAVMLMMLCREYMVTVMKVVAVVVLALLERVIVVVTVV